MIRFLVEHALPLFDEHANSPEGNGYTATVPERGEFANDLLNGHAQLEC